MHSEHEDLERKIENLDFPPVSFKSRRWLGSFIRAQAPLGMKFEKVLNENLWDLYAASIEEKNK